MTRANLPVATRFAPLRVGAFMALSLVTVATRVIAQQVDTLAQGSDSTSSPELLKKLSVEELMNVVVTSVSRRAESLAHVASAIQVITQEDIRRSGATSVPEALRLASNLQVAQVDSREWAISARGFNGTTANKLLVLIDGRTVYTPLFSGVFWDVQDVLLADIDRIEVISGPGATLWGANAVNGVINVITKSSKDTQGLLVSGGGGGALSGFGNARYAGTAGKGISYRVYGKGFDRQASVLPTTGLDAADDWQMGQGGFRVEWENSQENRFSLQGDAYGGQMTMPAGSDAYLNGGNVVGRWARTLSPTSDIRLRVYFDRTYRDNPGVFAEGLNTYDAEFQHRILLGRRHNVVWGVSYRLMDDRVRNSGALTFLPANIARSLFAGFVQDEITLVPERLSVALGTKLEHNEYTGFEIQPSGRVNWRMSRSGTLWAAVSRALRTPSRIDRELFAPANPPYFLAGGPDFHSEELLAYELGYRFQRRALMMSLATFYNRYDGLRSIEQANPPAVFPVVIGNGAEGESYGAELTAEYKIADAWRVRAGYTEMRINLWAKPTSTDASAGSNESQSPDRQFSLNSSVDLPLDLRVDAGLRSVGEIANQQLPGYTELDARLTWSPTDQLDLSLVGQNLLHRRHAEFGTLAARREIERGLQGAVEWHF
ncbi:MAG TPA: TonB-dependent receptor [Gemmatimonadales bacterium]|nr:TonB-dependent receptor [Gemmatimonadales bacterium]